MDTPPNLQEFKEYGRKIIAKIKDNPDLYSEWIEIKHMTWESDDWHKNVGGKRIPIKNWKTTFISCVPYREQNKTKKIRVNDPKVISITQRLLHGTS